MNCKSSEDFKKITKVPRETLLKLNKYLNILTNWRNKFNLISKNSFNDIWERHFLDSYQILNFIKNNDRILDIGSGAGFPGIICGICSKNEIDLVESNKKKVLFLNEVKNLLNLKKVKVHCCRAENFKTNIHPNVITARAVASLDKLFRYTSHLSDKKTNLLFLKGKSFDKEIMISKKKWDFQLKILNSITSIEGKLLLIKNLKKK